MNNIYEVYSHEAEIQRNINKETKKQLKLKYINSHLHTCALITTILNAEINVSLAYSL